MIDPKQGPLFRPGRNADPAKPSRTQPDDITAKDAGKRPVTSKRQFSVVGS